MNSVHIKLNKEGTMDAVPYQRCPLCDGLGSVIADGFVTRAVTKVCPVCDGDMIIPMHMVDSLISQCVMDD